MSRTEDGLNVFVEITVEGQFVRADLREGNDCSRLHILASNVTADQVDSALRAAGLGALSPGSSDHAELDLAGLRRVAQLQSEKPDWSPRFDAMVAYARSNSWVTADGSALIAHFDRS